MNFLPDTNVWIRFLNPGRNLVKNRYDLMIAAIGAVHKAVVVTHNTREFSRLATLRLEDWEL